jgi:4-amino-4-deoxy-L-arabinose transferase-like glycosyltransferase
VAGAALVALAAALVLLPGLGAAPFERAEIYFLDAARAMAETGDWLVPRYRGAPFYDKPALTYWLMAASMEAFGPTTAAGRLVSVVAALLAVAATIRLGALLLGTRAALCGGAALATTLAFVSFGRLAMSDMLMTLFATAAVAAGARATGERPPRAALPLVGALLGLGFLTKGPVAVLLPGLGLALLAWHRRRSLSVWGPGAALGLVLFAALGFGWFAFLAAREGAEPLRHFFMRENLQRFAASTYDAERPLWYYAEAYAALGLPWSLFLPAAVLAARRPAPPETRLLLGWAAAMAVPLSLSRGKIDYYLLPLLPPLSLAVGALFAAPWGPRRRAGARVALVLLAAVLAAQALGAVSLPAGWLPARALLRAARAGAAVLALGLLVVAVRARPLAVLGGVSAAALSIYLALAALFLPAFAAAQPHARLVEEVLRERAYVPEAGVVVCHDDARVQRDLLFHARLAAEERCALWSAVEGPPRLFVLDEAEQRSLGGALREVSTHRYVAADALTLRGLLARPQPRVLHLGANFDTTDPAALRKARQEWKEAVRAERARRRARSPVSPP